jgi:hypothetical protein
MISVKRCLGIKVQTSKDNRVYTQIHYSEDFPENKPDGTVVVGVQVGVINTTQSVALKVGDSFKAIYDSGQFWDSATRTMVNRPVLAEIQVVKS